MGDNRVAVIIEDDADVRELTRLVLTQSGLTVFTAADGPSGIEAVRERDPILTTLDVTMPGMDGFAVAKAVREFSSTYLIMVTALADEIDVLHGFEAGADDYLTKPFRPRELRARADAMMRRHRTLGHPSEGQSAGRGEGSGGETVPWSVAAARELRDSPLTPYVSVNPALPSRVRSRTPSPAFSMAGGSPAEQSVQPVQPAQPVRTIDPIQPATPTLSAQPVLRSGGLEVDTTTKRTTLDGEPLDVRGPEFELLTTLMLTGRRVRSKADLVLALRGEANVTASFVKEADKKKVDAAVASLRRKLKDDGERAHYIETVKGVGYRMAEAS